MMPRILFVTPRSEDAECVSRMLRTLPVSLDHAGDLQGARSKLQEASYKVILTEAALPDGYWQDVLQVARQSFPETEVIVTDPLADGRFWAEALNLGAYDLLAQPFYESEVRRILSNACTRVSRGPVAPLTMSASAGLQ